MSAPNPVRSSPRALWLPLAAASVLLSIGCASKKPAYAKVGYDPEKLATPPHNLSAHDYPFDDDGTYRKDWVTDKNAKRPKKWFGKKTKPPASTPPTVAMNQTAPPPTSAPPQTIRPPAPAPPPPSVRPAPTPPPAPKARYHKVSKGDTLFGISRRYGVSVSKLKSTNGLSSDLIRVGQSLRIP